MQTARHDAGLGSRSAVSALVAAAITGVVHGLFSIYWALGGNWLANTLGHQLVDAFAGRRWLLIPVAAVKIGFALLPLLLARWGRLGRRHGESCAGQAPSCWWCGVG